METAQAAVFMLGFRYLYLIHGGTLAFIWFVNVNPILQGSLAGCGPIQITLQCRKETGGW